jgi:hypothetical protein
MKNFKLQTSNFNNRTRTMPVPRMLVLVWSFRLGVSLVLGAWCLGLCSAHAQYSIDWFKVAGGGGTIASGQFALSGTIGQQDAGGPMTGGNYSLTGGFWALYSVIQTPGAPALYIAHSGNTVTVYWQAVSGWSLQQNNNLALPGGWVASSGVTTSNGTNYWSITQPTGNLFFQLKSP